MSQTGIVNAIPQFCSEPHYANPMAFDHVEAQLAFLEGKVLTVIDAAVAGPQNKAVKDLIRSAFREQLNHLRDFSGKSPRSGNAGLTASGVQARTALGRKL